jgi:hypothetical protein
MHRKREDIAYNKSADHIITLSRHSRADGAIFGGVGEGAKVPLARPRRRHEALATSATLWVMHAHQHDQ